MSAEKTVIVKSQEQADAFKALGFKDVQIEGASGGGSGEGDDSLEVLKAKVADLEKAVGDKDTEINTLKKAVEEGGGSGLDSDAIIKAFDSKFQSLGVIQKSIMDSIGDMRTEVEELVKGVQDEVSDMKSEIDRIGEADHGRRSLGGEPVQKAFTLDDRTGLKQLSKSQHGKAIIDLFDELSGSANDDTAELYSDATVRFETSGEITKAVIDDLAANHDIAIVK